MQVFVLPPRDSPVVFAPVSAGWVEWGDRRVNERKWDGDDLLGYQERWLASFTLHLSLMFT